MDGSAIAEECNQKKRKRFISWKQKTSKPLAQKSRCVPSLVHLCPLASWEIPYDFKPRISRHAQRVRSVVSDAWRHDAGTSTRKMLVPQRPSSSMPKEPSARLFEVDASIVEESVKERRRPFSAAAGASTLSEGKTAATQRQRRTRRDNENRSASFLDKRDTLVDATVARARHRRVQTNIGEKPLLLRPCSPAGVDGVASNTEGDGGALPTHRPAPPPRVSESSQDKQQQQKRKHQRYRRYTPRVQQQYALPPSYAREVELLQQSLSLPCSPSSQYARACSTGVDIVQCGSSKAYYGGPPRSNTVWLSRHQRQHTKCVLCSVYAQQRPDLVSEELRAHLAGEPSVPIAGDASVDAAATVAAVVPNMNFIPQGNFLEDTQGARVAAFYSREARMWDRLVDGVMPLSEALALQAPSSTPTDVIESGDGDVVVRASEGTGGTEGGAVYAFTGVLDDGHLNSPIVFLPQGVVASAVLPPQSSLAGNADRAAAAAEINGEVLLREIASGVAALKGNGRNAPRAVLVRPIASEVPTTLGEMRESEARRVLPKGREWDRQHAIRLAVGTTAQEALIDLKVDPRYRRPGEYLCGSAGRHLRSAYL